MVAWINSTFGKWSAKIDDSQLSFYNLYLLKYCLPTFQTELLIYFIFPEKEIRYVLPEDIIILHQ